MADDSQPTDLNKLAKVLYLSQGTLANGQPFYAYLSLTPENYKRLKADEAAGNFQLADYGDVLGGEVGVTEPAEYIRDKVNEIFEINDNTELIKQTFLEILGDDT